MNKKYVFCREKHSKGTEIYNKKERVIMSRTTRNNMENSSFFHIMVQGINKECIFNTDKNKDKYLKLIYKNNEGIEIMAYCIMDNHAHILVKINDIENLQKWMKKTNISYAIYYNKSNDRVGYVFRDRYKSQVIKNEKHLYTCVDYIHENPVKAFICNRKEDYAFSSYNEKYNGNQNEVKQYLQQILSSESKQLNDNEVYQDAKFEFIEEDDNSKEAKEKICKRIIEDFLQIKELRIKELSNEEKALSELVNILKYENDMSYRLMEKCLGIGRERIRRLCSKKGISLNG